MFQPPKMVSYQVPDLQKAKDWYARILNREPIFDSPMACVFSVDGCALVLTPTGDTLESSTRGVAFWHVDDIDESYRRLIEAGAESVTEITMLMLKSRIARLRDPFGNIVGIMSTSEKKISVDDRPSESALTVAFCRALAAYEGREEIRGPDNLAEIFLAEEGRKSLRDPAVRDWMIRKFCGTYEFFIARTVYGDRIFLHSLQDRIPQIVSLGAGYDTRPYRFRDVITGTRIFEVDALPTQQRKRQLLSRANIAEPPQLDYVSINFEKETPAEVLFKAGFRGDKETLWMWEGVSYYLSPDAVDVTLSFISSNSAPGSTLCFDYMVQAPDMANRYGVKTVLEAWQKTYSSEHAQFGIEEGSIGTFLSRRGFRLLENLTTEQIEKRFLTLKDGSLAGRVLALFNLARAAVASEGRT